jgi:hypothetical protein
MSGLVRPVPYSATARKKWPQLGGQAEAALEVDATCRRPGTSPNVGSQSAEPIKICFRPQRVRRNHLMAHSIACQPALAAAFRTPSRKYPAPRFYRLLQRGKASSATRRAVSFCGLLDRHSHRHPVVRSALLQPITWRIRRRPFAYFNLSVVDVRQQLVEGRACRTVLRSLGTS